MRVALVSPYSWTYPGGVTRHIEALAGELLAAGHDVRVLAPFDHDDRAAALRHGGARPEPRPAPPWLVSLGPTVGWPTNGSVSNLAFFPQSVPRLRRALAEGAFDVVHVHEPVAPAVGWDLLGRPDVPLVGTFHCHSEAVAPHLAAAAVGARRRLNRLRVRIAVSEAAAWTGRRFYGGRYRVVPNGVALPRGGPPPPRERAPGAPLRIVFVGQAVERKGLPVLLRAFEALRHEVPATLTVVGAEAGDLPVALPGVLALGRAPDADKHAALASADVLCAPSLGGESFGMVLTEAFAAGTPVVASDIAGYRGVVRDGVDGVLVPRGDAMALAETLRALALAPGRTAAMGAAAARSAERYAWPRVAEQVLEAYADARAVPTPDTATRRAATRVGLAAADGLPRVRARRLPPLDASPARPARARRRTAVAAAVGAAAVAGLAVDRIGTAAIGEALVRSSPVWVLASLGLFCLSMALRAVAWHASLRAALPELRPRLVDAFRGTAIGVLMSATLPARLGEPSRAYVVARRLGRPRDALPAVLGTLLAQTLLNVAALVMLGAVMLATVGLFAGRQLALLWYALAPLVVVAGVLAAPALLRSGRPSRSARVQGWVAQGRRALTDVRSGLVVFRTPRLGALATVTQLGAWAVQCLGCLVLFSALGLDAGLGAAAAVLFAVNVSAILPVTPSNVGVFQAACVAVLTGAYGVAAADAFAYGLVLQAVEVATAVALGAPALVREGLSWREVRRRALHRAPLRLAPLPSSPSS